jgi:hypothetical protein
VLGIEVQTVGKPTEIPAFPIDHVLFLELVLWDPGEEVVHSLVGSERLCYDAANEIPSGASDALGVGQADADGSTREA